MAYNVAVSDRVLLESADELTCRNHSLSSSPTQISPPSSSTTQQQYAYPVMNPPMTSQSNYYLQPVIAGPEANQQQLRPVQPTYPCSGPYMIVPVTANGENNSSVPIMTDCRRVMVFRRKKSDDNSCRTCPIVAVIMVLVFIAIGVILGAGH
ncbi:uncharacterized protein LOC144445003 [Glandiceps talaboti]